jgi:hypothetical protein
MRGKNALQQDAGIHQKIKIPSPLSTVVQKPYHLARIKEFIHEQARLVNIAQVLNTLHAMMCHAIGWVCPSKIHFLKIPLFTCVKDNL